MKKWLLLILVAGFFGGDGASSAEASYIVCISRQGKRHLVCSQNACPKGDRLEAFSSGEHPACQSNHSGPAKW